MENNIEHIISKLTYRQIENIDSNIGFQIKKLSIRSFNAIDRYLSSEFTLKATKEMIVNFDFKFDTIRNVGEKTGQELRNFFKKIRSQIINMSLINADDNTIFIDSYNTYLRNKLLLFDSAIASIWKNWDIKKGVPVFKTLDVLLKEKAVFTEIEIFIFRNALNFWQQYTMSLEELKSAQSKLKISYERIRQKKKQLILRIDEVLYFLKKFDIDVCDIYDIDVDKDVFKIDDLTANKIRKEEDVNFNNVVITKIIAFTKEKTHALVGNFMRHVLYFKVRNSLNHNWKYAYLVKNELNDAFDYEGLILDIHKRNKEKIIKDYTIDIKDYWEKFKKKDLKYKNIFKKVVPVIKYIVKNEFDIEIDDNKVYFKRNKMKAVRKYVYDALLVLDKPSKVDVIYDKIKELFPNFSKEKKTVLSAIYGSDLFVPFGKQSVWGLYEWKGLYKSGTMLDISEEFLLEQTEPKHINDIVRYVSRYRDNVKAKNLYNNLKILEHKRFCFFKGSYVGLVIKNYENNNEQKITLT